jgi:hypothetical protein
MRRNGGPVPEPEVRTSRQRRTSDPPGVVRHSVDFGLSVIVMTQVISCQLLIAQICSETLSPKCKLDPGFNAALLMRLSRQ